MTGGGLCGIMTGNSPSLSHSFGGLLYYVSIPSMVRVV